MVLTQEMVKQEKGKWLLKSFPFCSIMKKKEQKRSKEMKYEEINIAKKLYGEENTVYEWVETERECKNYEMKFRCIFRHWHYI